MSLPFLLGLICDAADNVVGSIIFDQKAYRLKNDPASFKQEELVDFRQWCCTLNKEKPDKRYEETITAIDIVLASRLTKVVPAPKVETPSAPSATIFQFDSPACSCGTKLVTGAKFCSSCGTKLDQAS